MNTRIQKLVEMVNNYLPAVWLMPIVEHIYNNGEIPYPNKSLDVIINGTIDKSLAPHQIDPGSSAVCVELIKNFSNNINQVFFILDLILSNNCYPDVAIFAQIISSCAHFGNIQYAEKIYEITRSEKIYHDIIFNNMIGVVARKKGIALAKKVYAEYQAAVHDKHSPMPTDHERKIVYHTMMDTLVRFGNIASARKINEESGIKQENEKKFEPTEIKDNYKPKNGEKVKKIYLTTELH